jgi:hypothetical protein
MQPSVLKHFQNEPALRANKSAAVREGESYMINARRGKKHHITGAAESVDSSDNLESRQLYGSKP